MVIPRQTEGMKRLLLLLPLLMAGEALANEQSIIDRIEAMYANQAESEARKEEARLSAEKERWREFVCPSSRTSVADILKGSKLCTSMAYDWHGWVQNGSIYATTRREIFHGQVNGIEERVEVDCKNLMIRLPEARLISEETELGETDPQILKRHKVLNANVRQWEIPSKGSETAMVAARCSAAD